MASSNLSLAGTRGWANRWWAKRQTNKKVRRQQRATIKEIEQEYSYRVTGTYPVEVIRRVVDVSDGLIFEDGHKRRYGWCG